MTLMSGTRLGPYEILGPLGAGGMGEVYRARDTRLGRDVAIKVLSETFAEDPERLRRFEQEARALAALSQPNIVQVFDTGEHERRPYLVMELVEGETLRQRIQKERLPWPKAAEILAAVADGLAVAHAKGIVHRDLKPENLVLTVDGQVKILDFGLAKLRPAPMGEATTVDAASTATVDGALLGTVGYMAPEQVQGRPADARSDLFALGCMLYEMVTGQRAFARDSFAETLAAILRDPVPQVGLSQGDPSVPELDRILSRCLQKVPGERFQSARDLAVALRTLTGTLTGGAGPAGLIQEAAGSKAIVVLPFENLSPDPENAYFADGLTEEVISDLAQVRALRVISRTSAMLLRGSKKDVPTIARELKVRYVLEGSVRRAGPSLRITAQLIDAVADAHLWAEKYTGTFEDVFDMQEKVSRAIVEALKLQLTPQEERRMAERPIPNVYAYECYLKAWREIWRFVEPSLDKALEHLEQGLRVIPDNPLLLAGMGYVHFQRLNMGMGHEDSLEKAEAFATRALELAPGLPQAHVALGLMASWQRGGMQTALAHFEEVLSTDPNDLDALKWSGVFHAHVGATAEAAAMGERAIALDPMSPMSFAPLVFAHWLDGRFDAALEVLERASKVDPSSRVLELLQVFLLILMGRHEEAFALAERAKKDDPLTIIHRMALLWRYAFVGEQEKALSWMPPEALQSCRRDFQYSWWVACAYVMLGHADTALDWLENAVELGFLNYRYLDKVDPVLAPLRGDPRFRALMSLARERAKVFEA